MGEKKMSVGEAVHLLIRELKLGSASGGQGVGGVSGGGLGLGGGGAAQGEGLTGLVYNKEERSSAPRYEKYVFSKL